MAIPERSRRLIGNVWQYVTASENGGGGSLPPGGSTGEVLAKQSNADGDVGWDPSGGSQPGVGVIYGPYTVLAADFPDDNDFVDVVTVPIGAAVLDWWVDPDTFVPYDFDTVMGQGPEFNAQAAISVADPGVNGSLGEPAHGADTFVYSGAANALNSPAGGYGRFNRTQATFAGSSDRQKSSLLVTQTADPIRIYRISTGIAGGSMDLYFLIATDMTAPATIT